MFSRLFAAAFALGLASSPHAAGKEPTMQDNRRIAIVLTSHDRLGSTGKPTGFYLSEASHPHKVFTDAGFVVDFISPKGGKAPVDGVKREDPINAAFLDNPEIMKRIDSTLAVEQVSASDYAAIFFAGGHGTMWDFPNDTALQHLTARIYERGGVVAAVCHGPSALVNVRLGNGKFLVEGKNVNSFTDEEEQAVNLTEVVPFLLESALRDRGGRFTKAQKFQPHVVADERLVTGQNPASATGVAQEVVRLLQSADAAPGVLRYETRPAVPSLSTPLMVAGSDPEQRALRAFLAEPPKDSRSLAGRRAAILATDGVEEIEITGPLEWLRARGAVAHVVSPEASDVPKLGLRYPESREHSILTVRFMENAGWLDVDRSLAKVTPEQYDVLIIPGGAWNPDVLRNTPPALELVRGFVAAGKPVAAICHGPQVLISAGVLKGRKATGWWSIKTDLINAGASFQDEPVVVDQHIITSRYPLDLPSFMAAIETALQTPSPTR
jgi:PfpI family intracellular protease